MGGSARGRNRGCQKKDAREGHGRLRKEIIMVMICKYHPSRILHPPPHTLNLVDKNVARTKNTPKRGFSRAGFKEESGPLV